MGTRGRQPLGSAGTCGIWARGCGQTPLDGARRCLVCGVGGGGTAPATLILLLGTGVCFRGWGRGTAGGCGSPVWVTSSGEADLCECPWGASTLPPPAIWGRSGTLGVAQQGAPVCTELPGCALQRG